ncbi:hypothetical protein BaRGS_00021074 [Batillaria attramentaria]|uniref:Uncharacterized protein n=1 Tax=Batillaria attramentaria TaxID=370345 RepID=A0ABD0KKY6_9CAEN
MIPLLLTSVGIVLQLLCANPALGQATSDIQMSCPPKFKKGVRANLTCLLSADFISKCFGTYVDVLHIRFAAKGEAAKTKCKVVGVEDANCTGEPDCRVVGCGDGKSSKIRVEYSFIPNTDELMGGTWDCTVLSCLDTNKKSALNSSTEHCDNVVLEAPSKSTGAIISPALTGIVTAAVVCLVAVATGGIYSYGVLTASTHPPPPTLYSF